MLQPNELEIVCDALAASMSEKLFDGKLPENPAAIAWGMAMCITEHFPQADYNSIERLADALTVALSHRIAIEKEKRREVH